ncbi:GFA family protein [Francisella noatunensis]
MSFKGLCLCNSVQFEINGSFENFFLCHCEHCRKDTGSAHAANLFSSNAKLNWQSGQEFVKNINYLHHIIQKVFVVNVFQHYLLSNQNTI